MSGATAGTGLPPGATPLNPSTIVVDAPAADESELLHAIRPPFNLAGVERGLLNCT